MQTPNAAELTDSGSTDTRYIAPKDKNARVQLDRLAPERRTHQVRKRVHTTKYPEYEPDGYPRTSVHRQGIEEVASRAHSAQCPRQERAAE